MSDAVIPKEEQIVSGIEWRSKIKIHTQKSRQTLSRRVCDISGNMDGNKQIFLKRLK